MNARPAAILLALALWLAGEAANTQGFAGLGADAEGFAMPQPGVMFDFPEDHGAHPTFRIEWWYVTANLTGPGGRDYGLQWTLFRSALAPREGEGWESPQLWMGHAAVTTPDRHFVAERLARGGIEQAGVTPQPFRAWIDEWEMQGPMLSEVTLSAHAADFGYDVSLFADRPFVPHGEDGYSVKSPAGQASYYYSQPFYRAEGTLHLPGGPVPVTGTAWLDREWSSQPLSETQSGWDWFSLSFDSGARLMGFRLRDSVAPAYTSATWIEPDGTPTAYPDGAFRAEPLEDHSVAGRILPVRWRLTLPDRSVDVEIEAINRDAWMATRVPYWEGPVAVEGSHEGRGYLEMTGYE